MKTIIGIDPGAINGVAISTYSKIRQFKSLNFWETTEVLKKAKGLTDAIEVWIEDPGKNKPVFLKKGCDNEKAYRRVAQNVGANKRDAQLLIEFCKLNYIPVIAVRPSRKKLNAAEFAKLTGITERLNQHERDAGMLIFGRK